MNPNNLQHKLIAVARSTPPDNRVPYAFQKRVMARVRAAQADVWSAWSSLLWRAAIPSICIMILTGAFTRFGKLATGEQQTGELEIALMAPIAADNETW